MIRSPGEGHFWQVDHIKPVSGGGGQCSLDNLQTLCTVCHREVSDACRHIWLHPKTANWKLCIQVWRIIGWISILSGIWDVFYSFHYLPLEFFLEVYASSPEKAMAPHSSTLAWKIPWMEEPGELQSMGSLRVGHDWATSLSLFTFMHWRRKWQPTPVFLPGESQGRGSLLGCHRWGRTESDMTEVT